MSNALPLQLRGRFVPGALRAAPILPLLLALNAAQPAHAQLPRPSAEVLPAVTVTAPAIVNIDTGTDASPLTLLANHVDIRIVGTQARVRTTLTWRNNGPVPVEATYRAPLPSALARLVVDDFDGCGDALDAREADDNDEAVEAGETASGGRALVLLAPGEEVRVTVEREAALIARGDRQRLVLPLFTQRNGAFTPQFSATASIDAERPIVELNSGTHPVEVSGLGEPQARAVIPNGRVYEGQFLALDFTLGTATAAEPPPTVSARGWGGEGFARVVAR